MLRLSPWRSSDKGVHEPTRSNSFTSASTVKSVKVLVLRPRGIVINIAICGIPYDSSISRTIKSTSLLRYSYIGIIIPLHISDMSPCTIPPCNIVMVGFRATLAIPFIIIWHLSPPHLCITPKRVINSSLAFQPIFYPPCAITVVKRRLINTTKEIYYE